MKINATMLFHQIRKYFQVNYSYIYGHNLVKTPMFYTRFFRMDEHIVLLQSENLTDCLKSVNHASIICLDPPKEIPSEKTIGTNDLIILDDPMSSSMAFNILNHILDIFNEWEMDMNDILYQNKSFQDMVDLIGDLVGLPISLSDTHFRYIAFSKDSVEYIDEFVTEQNKLPLKNIIKLQQDPEFSKLELIREAFEHTGIEHCVHINIYDSQDTYVGRMSVIIRNATDDIEYCKSIFQIAAPYIEALYTKYNSFTNLNLIYKQVHDYMQLIFNHQPADRQGFYQVMKRLGNDYADWQVMVLRYKDNVPKHLSSTYIGEQLENEFAGCYAIPQKDHIVILFNQSRNTGRTSEKRFRQMQHNIQELSLTLAISRTFHTLTTFEVIYFAYKQALYALEQGNLTTSDQATYYFDDYALDYLMYYGSQEVSYLQICHPGLLTLARYDKDHGTTYIKTLRTYMDCNMNAVAAAKALYIHRSSFINRMERMKNQVDLKLEDPRERLYINLSLALYGDLLEQ